METNDIPVTEVSEWQPITDKVDLAVLGKLGEEVSECGAAIFRCIIQGIDECEPTTKKINRDWLMDEIADVEAMIMHAKRHFQLDEEQIVKRRFRKYGFKMPWFKSLAQTEMLQCVACGKIISHLEWTSFKVTYRCCQSMYLVASHV